MKNAVRRLCFRSMTLALAAVVPGCLVADFDDEAGADDGEEIGESAHEVISQNGMSLNGMSLNGMSLNGMSLNGMNLNGMNLNGMNLNGMNLNGMNLNGSQLQGVQSNGQPISGLGLVGTTMGGTLSNGGSLALRIDSAATLPAPNSDVWAYGVSYALAGGSWAPLCGTSSGVNVLAVPVAGTWNYGSGVTGGGAWSASSGSFTFACRGTAIAKCVELGYKPWRTVGGVLLRDHHQACTRMIRADYCGNGQSWTVDGTTINVYDNLGIQVDASTALKVDAEWITTGARCINEVRDFWTGKPDCHSAKKGPGCGNFTKGALIVDEYKAPPAPPAPPPAP
jgi:hypothetical protein